MKLILLAVAIVTSLFDKMWAWIAVGGIVSVFWLLSYSELIGINHTLNETKKIHIGCEQRVMEMVSTTTCQREGI